MASKTAPSDLASWLGRQRWFAGKARGVAALEIIDRVPIGAAALVVLGVTLRDGAVDRYAAPLLATAEPRDALDDPGFCRALLDLVADARRAEGEHGLVLGTRTRAFPAAVPAAATARRLGAEQSNTSVRFGDVLVLKHFRRLVPGDNPDVEITRFLTERTSFRHTPRLAGALAYVDEDGVAAALGVVQEYVVGGADGWAWMLERLAAGDAAPHALETLGRRTGQLHVALASAADDPAFVPEPIGATDVSAWSGTVAAQIAAAQSALGTALPSPAAPVVDDVGEALTGLVGRAKQRHHGDFHLGQTLYIAARDDFAIIDFEGEPLRPLEERRRKHTPLRDVAGMLRSLHYAVATARCGAEADMRSAFLAGYRAATVGAPFVGATPAATARAVAVFELEKAAYEIVYEAGHRPDWIGIPLAGYARAIAALAPGAAAAGAA